MASSYSTDLKLEIQVTGENAGTWGDITNTNLVILQQAIAGYSGISIAGGAGNTDLTFSNGLTSNGKNAVLELTGTITGNRTVTITTASGVTNKVYVIRNSTTGAFHCYSKNSRSNRSYFLCNRQRNKNFIFKWN
jgi:hypothetical protein